jgi:hypothetical protein
MDYFKITSCKIKSSFIAATIVVKSPDPPRRRGLVTESVSAAQKKRRII